MPNCIKYIFPVFICLIFLIPGRAKADHIMGAEITWKYVAGDTFLFTVSVYRNCEGIKLANTPLQYFSDCPGYTKPVSVSGTICCTKDITPDFGFGCDRCGSASCANPYGIQLTLIQAKIVFPKACCHWYVSWQQSSRDGAITTGAAGKNFYTEAELYTCQYSYHDNSPVFNQPAQNIFAVSKCQQIDYSAYDIDSSKFGKDSLFYRMVPPLAAHNSPISYLQGYSYDDPFKTDNGTFDFPCPHFNINRTTGKLSFQPSKVETSTMCIQVDELRPDSFGNYHKIGSIRRDIEVMISYYNSNNHFPVITGINGGTANTIKICAGQTTCFDIKAFDIDPKDSVTMKWDHGIANGTFRIVDATKKWPTAVFCWTPKNSDIRPTPYRFVVSAKDNYNPLNGTNARSFSIYVIGSPEATYSATLIGCGMVRFHADVSASSLTSISDYVWQGDQMPIVPPNGNSKNFTWQFTRAGTFHYTLTITGPDGCTKTYRDSITIPPFVSVSLGGKDDTIICEKSPNATLFATEKDGTPPYSYSWNTGEKTNQKSATITKDTVFMVTIKDGQGCTNYDSIQVKFKKPTPPDPLVHLYTCNGQGLVLSPKVSSQVIWTKIVGGQTYTNFSQDNPLIVNDSGLYVATSRNSAICPGTDSFFVSILPKISHNNVDTNICFGDTVYLANNIQPRDLITYNGILTINSRKLIVANDSTIFRFYAITTFTRHGVTCLDTVIYTMRSRPIPKPKLSKPPAQCVKNPALWLNPYVDKQHQGGYWNYPYHNFSIVSNYLYPDIAGVTDLDKGAWIHYIYSDKYRCRSDDSVKINIFSRPYAGPDITVWRTCGLFNLSRKAVPNWGGTWTAMPGTPSTSLLKIGDSTWFNPDSVPSDGRYGLIYSYRASKGSSLCDGSDTMYIYLMPKRKILIQPVDSMCENGDYVNLSANPNGGFWDFADSTNPVALRAVNDTAQRNSFFPSKAGPGYHLLKYTVKPDTSRASCPDTAFLRIYVVPVPKIDFTTIDSQTSYCSNANWIQLIPNTPGGTFTGKGVTMTGDTAWLDPSNTTGIDTITYSLPNKTGNCSAKVSHSFNIVPAPQVSLYNDTVMCSDNNTFIFKAKIKNVTDIQWHSTYNKQDGGYFTDKVIKDSIIAIRYVPGPDQLKQKQFTVYISAWGNAPCDTIHLSHHIRIKQGPLADFISDREGCDPFTTKFKNLSTTPSGHIIQYNWDFGDSIKTQNANPVHTYTADSTAAYSFYTVKLEVRTNEGCATTITKHNWIIVDGAPRPIIDANPTFTTLDRPEIHFSLDPSSKNIDTTDTATKYFWYFFDPPKTGISILKNPDYAYSDTGKYSVKIKVINGNRCVGYDSIFNYITVRPAFAIFIPNIFMPGKKKDGSSYKNSFFKPVISSYSTFQMNIYNRWGEKMASFSDPDPGWDGSFREGTVPEGVYIYEITVNDLYGKSYGYKGTVQVLR